MAAIGVPPAEARLDPRLELGWKLPDELAEVAYVDTLLSDARE